MLGVLVFTSCVKALYFVGIELKSVVVVGFGVGECLVMFVGMQRLRDKPVCPFLCLQPSSQSIQLNNNANNF